MDDQQVRSFNLADFNMSATDEFQLFTGFWGGDDNSRIVEGYVDNIEYLESQ